MKTDIVVPEIGESISSGILAAWLKSDGEIVSEGDEIFELETDKATLAVPSPASGALTTAVAQGDEVSVGQVVGTIEGDAAASSGKAPEEPNAEPDAAPDRTQSGAETPLSPAVRRIVEEHKLDPAAITGTGPKGRITKEDALAAAKMHTASQASSPATPSPPVVPSTAAATPAVKAAAPAPSGEQRRVPMSNLRRRIAENLVRSKQTSAHVTTFNEVNMKTVMEIRKTYRDAFEKEYGVRLGFMSFFIKACQYALEQTPEVNAYLDGTDILYNDAVNIGVALSSEKGLLTPVIKDVASKTFGDIERSILDFITRANQRRMKPDEMMGATFTISNGGVFGSMLSTPIPSPPQTAVLGMHAIEKRPVVVEDEVVVRPMMYLALTYDHRMIDGREAVGFLGTVKEVIEDPTRLLLGL